MKAFLVALVAMSLTATLAFRFDLHNDGTPTCFDFEVDAGNRGGLVRIRYETNTTSKTISGSSGTVTTRPSPLQIAVYYPRAGDDRVATTDKRSVVEHLQFKVDAEKGGARFSFNVDPFAKSPASGKWGNNERPEVVLGTYEVCFNVFRYAGVLANLFSAARAAPERATVHLDMFANELLASNPDEAAESQRRFAQRDEAEARALQDHANEHDKKIAQRRAKKQAAKELELATEKLKHNFDLVRDNNIDALHGSLHNVQRLLRETTRGVEELRMRHEVMRATSESTFSRVWIFSALTMVAMAFSFWRQYASMKRTLKDKKLV